MATRRRAAQSEPVKGKGALQPAVEISDFLLHTCHDIKTALRSVRVRTEMMAKEHAAGDMANFTQHVGAILTDAGKLERLANGLVGYSVAVQIDPQSFVPTPMEVILRTALAMLSTPLREAGAEVTYDPLPRVLGDPDRLRQLLDNLLGNSLTHRGDTAPRIHISAVENKGDWLFSVRDNGLGLEPAYLERIFEPFERLRGHQAPGTGLGLTICREIVQRHGGKIWAESEPGSGATLFFTLPVSS